MGNIVPLPEETWVKISDADKYGRVVQRSGDGLVAFVQSPVIPVGYDNDTPVVDIIRRGEAFNYYGVLAVDFVWAYASKDSTIAVTPLDI